MLERSVFIVDDDYAVRDSLRALLEVEGMTVATFGSAKEFLATYNPTWSGCVLTDLRMPYMSGLELQSELIASGGSLSVVVISGHGDIAMAVQALRAGAVDFIEKPFTDESILAAVRLALTSKRQAQCGEGFTAAEVSARLAGLTPREYQVLDQLVIGQPNKIIAYELGISPRTVEIHRARVMGKMQARSLSHLVRMVLAAGSGPASP